MLEHTTRAKRTIKSWSYHLVLILLQVDDVIRNIPGQAEVDHPVHEVEGDEHDGEDDPAVLVDITGPHSKYPSRRVGRQWGARLAYWGEERGSGL